MRLLKAAFFTLFLSLANVAFADPVVPSTDVFEAFTPNELPTRFYVPLSSLIPGDTSGLLVALYPEVENPNPNAYVHANTYLPGVSPKLVIPLYRAPLQMSRFQRPLSAINVGSASSPGGGTQNVADHTDVNNAYLANLGG